MIDLYFLLALVMGVSIYIDFHYHKGDHEMTLKESSLWSLFWIVVGSSFGLIVWSTHGADNAALYYSGYVMEKALSVDNLVVFIAIFSYFGINDSQRKHKILMYGIAGALIFRAIFVSLGTSLFKLHWTVQIVFGLIVLWTSYAMLKGSSEDDEKEDYENKWFSKLVKKIIPYNPTSSNNFFTVVNGIRMATPMLLCVVVIEFSDILFSFDSVPAVIGITQEPVLVYSAIIMAVLGLRALYFVLGSLMHLLSRLETFVGFILAFIGLKLIIAPFGFKIDPISSLFVVVGLLVTGVVLSIVYPKKS